jgi:hypothetical protein
MATFICPMHADIRESASADCPKCGMKLVLADSRFPLLAHMMGRPVHLAAMIALMLALMAGAMMLMR